MTLSLVCVCVFYINQVILRNNFEFLKFFLKYKLVV